MTRAGKPMTFIGQLNFGEIAQAMKTQKGEVPPDLPQAGVLAFFPTWKTSSRGDAPADQQHWAVRWTPNPQTATQAVAIAAAGRRPEDLPARGIGAPRCLPSPDDAVFFPAEIQNDDLVEEYAALAESMVEHSQAPGPRAPRDHPGRPSS